MRNRFKHLYPIFDYLGPLLWTTGFLLFVPLVVLAVYSRAGRAEVSPLCFVIPACLSLALGFVLKRKGGFRPLDRRSAMLLCVAGWVTVSAIGALPLYLSGALGYLDAFFESVSGFTTTGITMLVGLDEMPRSLLFWRALTQWLGGLGILAFFLAVAQSTASAHRLFTAESHKIFSKRPAPSLFRTLKILWAIYACLTAGIALLLVLEGVSLFDSLSHAMTCLSTGGYSPYDASIAHYREAGFAHYRLIEYTVILGMICGGMNFFVHYRVATGGIAALWDNAETRLYWIFIGGATGLILIDRFTRFQLVGPGDAFRNSLFQTVSILTTTGFGTQDIGGSYFPALSKQIFLILMVIGGCVGSTGGGFKVLRVAVLLRMVGRQLKRIIHGTRSVNVVTVDGDVIDFEELRRIAALFFAWIILLAIGGGATALLSDHGPIESASGMFSALGNIGPCYISVRGVTELHPVIKLTYILGMLAGRLEILPVLLLFSRRTWR